MSKVKRKRDANEDKDEEAEPAAEEAPMSSTSRAATLAAFTGTGADLAASLQTSSLDGLRASLTTLRTLTSRNSHDERLAPSDKRIQLATEFCRAGGIGQSGQGHSDSRGLLNAWDIIDTQEQVTLLPFPLFVLSNIISLLGSHQPTHDLADEIIQTILPASASSSNVDSALSRPTTENHYWNRLQTYLSQSGVRSEASLRGKQVQNKGSQEVVTMSALRLLLEMTTFAGGKYARSVFDNMNWTMKSLPRLLSMRRRTNNSKKAAKTVAKPKNAVTLDRPDIRTLWILFLLSFLCSSTGVNQPVSLQVAILTLGKDFLPAILKGLSNDSPQIVVHVLMALHAGLISDEAAAKLPRSKVVGFFSEWACKELLALYDRETDLVSVAATGERHSIADVVHHFMLALCTHPGRGICYVDQGWHGRQQHVSNGREEDDKESDNEIEGSSTAVFNKILLGLLKSLSPTRSSKQAELTLRILAASKELLSPYLQATTGSLSSASVEPRTMSIAWLSTAAFMGRVLGTPLPEASKWRSLPPSFDRCVHFLLPASLTKSTFIRGIQHKDRLTRHGALILLSRVLDRLHRFKDLCQHMSSLHDEKTKDIHIVPEELSTTEKEEAILRGECYSDADQQKSWMKMCSDVMNEARQQIPDLTTILSSIDVDLKPKKAEEATVAAPPTRSMLIVEAALRSARLHYKVFEEATTSDLGKLLSNASLSSLQADEGPPNMDGDERLSLVCRLHVIQLLTHYAQQNTGGVDLFVRQSGKDTTAFRHLLRLASSPIQDQVRDASRDLIKEAMLGTILFEHNVKEWDVWQYALDKTSDFLLDFFDECVQRCLKTPYRYIEMARVALTEVHDTLCAGPIFFVMLEQYTIRLQSGFLEDNSSKVAFWDFVEQFIPAMLAINGDDMTRPLVTVLRSRIEEAMTSDDERIVNGEMKKISEESRDSIGSAYHTVASKYDSMIARPLVAHQSMEGPLRHATQARAGIALDGESERTLAPTDLIWKATRGVIPEGVTVDWDRLLFSPIETKMMLSYVQYLLAADQTSIEVARDLLNMTLAHGQVDAESLVELLQEQLDEAAVSDEQSLFGIALSQAVAEAPLDLEDVKERLTLPQIPWDRAYDEDEDDDDEEEDVRVAIFSQYSEALVKLNAILDRSFRDEILQTEQDLQLYYEAASGFGHEARLLQGGLLRRLDDLIKSSKDIKLVSNALLMTQGSSEVMLFSFEEEAARLPAKIKKQVIESLLDRSDLGDLDAVLSKVLPVDRTQREIFCKSLLASKDVSKTIALLPYTVARVMDAVLKEGGLDEQIDSATYRASIQACISRMFNAPQAVALPLAQACLSLCDLSGLAMSELQSLLYESLPSRPSDAFKPSAHLLARSLVERSSTEWLASSFLQSLMDKSLLWLVRRFAEDEEESIETMQGVEALLSLLDVCISNATSDSTITLKAHLVEPVLLAAVVNRLGSRLHLRLIRRLIKLSDLKATIVQKIFADILQNRDATTDDESAIEVVAMVYEAVEKDTSLCTVDLVASLVKLYKGTLSKADRKVVKLLCIHESRQGISALSYLQHWEAIPKQTVGEIDLGLVSRLDPIRVHETCLKFPRSRAFEDLFASGYTKDSDEEATQNSVYDPLLILAAAGALLTRDEPMSGLHWLELIRTNALGIVVCCLSSRWPSTRSIAITILAKVYSRVALADFQEKDHMLLVLDFARNSYGPDDVHDSAHPSSLPLTTTLFVAHSLRSLGIPSLYLYPLISRFMLQRPTPDPTDVPLLYNFLYSSSAQSTTAKSEKIFILRYILACIKYGGSLEWKIMKRRHVWDSLCSLYAADGVDGNIKRIIEDVFLAVSKKSDLAFRVVVRHSWLNYITQVHLVESEGNKERSRRFWIKCIANMLESIDLDRMQSSIGGSLILSRFAAIIDQLQLIPEEDDIDSDKDIDLASYSDQLRAIQALSSCKDLAIDFYRMLSTLDILGDGWSLDSFNQHELPLEDVDAKQDNSELLRECKNRVRHIRACVARNGLNSADTSSSSSSV